MVASVSLIPSNWREPVFFDCLLKAGRVAVSQDAARTIDDSCKETLTTGFAESNVASSSAEMELLGMAKEEVVTMDELITKGFSLFKIFNEKYS